MNRDAKNVLRSLQALRTRYQQEEDTATKTLAAAIRARDDAARQVDLARQQLEEAERALRAAREEARQASQRSCTAMTLMETERFVARQRDACQAMRDALAKAEALLSDRQAAMERARQSLAQARGQREAVDKRIERMVAETRRMSELRAEDEAGDRAAADHYLRVRKKE